MPYQGAEYQGYVPSGNYGHAFPNGQPVQNHYGQAQPGSASHLQQRMPPATYNTPPIARNTAAPPGSAYGPPSNYSQTAYSTPQYYDQNSASSYYQTPASNFPPQYLSPPSQSAQLPQQYSPDPLHYYQPPLQPHRGTPTQSHTQSQQRPPTQQYRHPQPQAQRSQQAQRQPTQGVQWTSHSTPARPPSASSQVNAASAARNSQILQQSSPRQKPYQQRAPPSPEQPVKAQRQPTAQPAAVRPSSQQRPVATPTQGSPTSATRHVQSSASQQPQRTSSQQQQQRQSSTPRSTTIDPSVLLRKVAQVEIPVQKQSIKVEPSDEMARVTKRRKSHDGKANPVCEPEPAPQHRPVKLEQIERKPSSSSAANGVRSSQHSSMPQQPSIDYQSALLSLSDEYINAAYSMAGDLETAEVSAEQLDHYHHLLSTGMGCLDAVLKHYHLSDPRKEARIRLRYATLLHEETDNDIQAEEVLSKGVSLCQRARLPDLQYAMHHLLARIWFAAGKTKAALKTLDKLIVEVEKLNMLHWVYAFHFLRVSLALQKDLTNSETMSIVRNLTAVSAIANRHSHISVFLVASTMEALVHLRSKTPESVDNAQRAIANARMHQLSPEMTTMPQIKLLLDCIDLGCALSRPTQDRAPDKTQAMQQNMDECTRDTSWADDGTFLVPLCNLRNPADELERDTCSIFKTHQLGETVCALPLKWLTRNQVYALGFLLSGLGFMNSNSHEQRAERFLNEGLKVSRRPRNHAHQSLTSASNQYELNRRMRILLRLHVVFAFVGRAEWQSALKGLGNIHADVKELGSDPGKYIADLLIFLEGTCKHGLGDLTGALQRYHSPQLKVEGIPDPKSPNANPISVLAALNSVSIMRLMGGGREPELLLNQVSEYCLTHKNNNGNDYGSKPMEAALFALKALEPTDPGAENTIIKTKHYLQSAIAAAKSVVNNRLLAIVMGMMTAMFFGRIVGEQAEKSARAGRSLAKKSQDKLWMAVSDNMFCNTLDKCGKLEEANAAKQEAQGAMSQLPKPLQAALLARDQDNE